MNALRQIAMFLAIITPLGTFELVYSQVPGPSIKDRINDDLNRSFGQFLEQQRRQQEWQREINRANEEIDRLKRNIPDKSITEVQPQSSEPLDQEMRARIDKELKNEDEQIDREIEKAVPSEAENPKVISVLREMTSAPEEAEKRAGWVKGVILVGASVVIVYFFNRYRKKKG